MDGELERLSRTGSYEGVAPAGKPVSWIGAQIDRFQDGKIAETCVVWDKYRLFAERGLVG